MFAFFALVAMLIFQSCKKEEASPLNSPKFKELSANMQKLWSEHMQWTYQTVDAFFHEPDALNANLERLLEKHWCLNCTLLWSSCWRHLS